MSCAWSVRPDPDGQGESGPLQVTAENGRNGVREKHCATTERRRTNTTSDKHRLPFDGHRRVAHDAAMTIRREVDTLVDDLESEYTDATDSAGEARVVATAALRSVYLLADALDALTQQMSELDRTDHQLVNELRTEISDLRLKIEHLKVTTKRTRR
jgi:hypothetical protein